MAPASCPKFVDGLRFDRSSRTCSPDDGKLRAIDDVLGACNLKGEKRPLIASSFSQRRTLRGNTWGGNTSGVRMPERFCFYRIYSHVSRLFLSHLFFSSNYAICLTITLSSYLPRINECFLLVAFSDYRIVLPLVVFLSSFEKKHIANFESVLLIEK